MCRIDGAERVELFNAGTPKARKEHRCDECDRAIMSGEKYTYEVGKCEGEMLTFKTCSHCAVAREWLNENCGGFIYRQVRDEIVEHAEEYPHLAEPLMQFAISMAAKWRDDSGLIPIPQQAPPILAKSGRADA